MGKTTISYCNHNLDTSGLEALAKDLSKRFSFDIEYGYDNEFDFLSERKKRYSSNMSFIKLGDIQCEKPLKKVRLTEEDYQYRHFEKLFGKQALKDKYFKTDDYSLEQIEESSQTLSFDLESIDENLKNKEDSLDLIVTIFNNSLEIWDVERCHWHSFRKCFIYHSPPWQHNLEHLEQWRKEQKAFIEVYGGTELITGCFESKSMHVLDHVNKKITWDELKTLGEKKFADLFLNIAEFSENNKFKDLPRYEDVVKFDARTFWARRRGYSYVNPDKANYHELFFDDFKDLI